jgi:hypothetical protein
LLQKYPFTLKQDRILKKYQLVKQYTILITTRKDWCMPGKIADPYVVISYTDGSGISNRFGAGVHEPTDNHRERSTIGGLYTVFPDDVTAVLRCKELLLPENVTRKRTYICPDSRAAIAAPA